MDRKHPLQQLLISESSRLEPTYVRLDTKSALYRINDTDHLFLIKGYDRLLCEKDYFSEASSFLAEIRAYGTLSLVACFDNVEHVCEGKTPTADFEVKCEDETVMVEVNAPQMKDEERKGLDAFYHQRCPEKERIKDYTLIPFGRPKNKENPENVTINVISKLCAIKQIEHQISNDYPAILWVDFQDEIWHMESKTGEYPFPVITSFGELYSNPLWYAFYGYKGAPVFEGHSFEEYTNRQILTMAHNGRFHIAGKTKYDAVVFSFPNSLFAYENPYARNPIPKWFWEGMTTIRYFDIGRSKLNWLHGNLQDILATEKDFIDKLSKCSELVKSK